MDYIIKKFSENKHAISETESVIIKRAIPFYKNLLERYEDVLLEAKEENITVIGNNPFDVNSMKGEDLKSLGLPTLEEIRTFVYSAWAKTVADVQTPFGCSGQKKKGIFKNSFREIQKGKYINKNVREIADNFIRKIIISLNIEENETL